jgi:hypothetical protein
MILSVVAAFSERKWSQPQPQDAGNVRQAATLEKLCLGAWFLSSGGTSDSKNYQKLLRSGNLA